MNTSACHAELESIELAQNFASINPVALQMAKTLWSFGHSECNRVYLHVGKILF